MSSIGFLIDTDWVIDHFNGISEVTERLKELEPRGFALSIVSVAELWEGVHFSREPARSQTVLEEFLANISVINIDDEICKRFGHLRGTLRRRGQIVADFDLLIATSALRHGFTLLTNNRRHYQAISGLRLESRAIK